MEPRTAVMKNVVSRITSNATSRVGSRRRVARDRAARSVANRVVMGERSAVSRARVECRARAERAAIRKMRTRALSAVGVLATPVTNAQVATVSERR